MVALDIKMYMNLDAQMRQSKRLIRLYKIQQRNPSLSNSERKVIINENIKKILDGSRLF